MSGANTLSSTIRQVAVGLGVAVGALALRLSRDALPSVRPRLQPGTMLAHYQAPSTVIAVVMLYPVAEAVFGLHPAAGGEVAGQTVTEDA